LHFTQEQKLKIVDLIVKRFEDNSKIVMSDWFLSSDWRESVSHIQAHHNAWFLSAFLNTSYSISCMIIVSMSKHECTSMHDYCQHDWIILYSSMYDFCQHACISNIALYSIKLSCYVWLLST
jgi:hypothetical protein